MKLRESKAFAVGAMVLIVIVIIVAICTHLAASVWEYSVLFLAFMTVFCHLSALSLMKMSMAASRKLDNFSLVLGVLTVIDLIVVFIFNYIAFP